MRRFAVAVVPVVVAVVGLGACSSGGGGALSKADFVKKVNALCKPAQKKQDALRQAPDAGAKEYAAAAEKAVAIQDKLISDIKALKPPSADQKTIDQLIDVYNQVRVVFEQLITALKGGDLSALNRFTDKITSLENQYREIARGYGLTDCAS